MIRRGSGGYLYFEAKDEDGAIVSGDAANISVVVSSDGSEAAAPLQSTPFEIGTSGTYQIFLEPVETLADLIVGQATSSTGGVFIDPIVLYTEPPKSTGLSDPSPFGKWRIDGFSISDLKASLSLREAKSSAEVKVPKSEFDLTTYPDADGAIIDEPIPIGFGVVKGAATFQIDTTSQRFKFLDHACTSIDRIYDGDNVTITPTTINLTLSEFTWTSWTDEDLFVDYTADLDNPVDVAKELLIGDVRGADISSGSLDTTSTGKGFGSSGARLHYIAGYNPEIGAAAEVEVSAYPIGLHVEQPTEIKKLLDQIQAACFGFIFIDFSGKWTFKPWKSQRREDLEIVTEKQIVGELKPRVSTSDVITKVIANYQINPATSSKQKIIKTTDEQRQLRGLTAHTVLEKDLIISHLRGAKAWASKTAFQRGNPRWTYPFRGTSELKLKEPGDYIRLNYAPQNIDECLLITSVRKVPGETTVDIECANDFGYNDRIGYYTENTTLTFPDEVGGGTFADWSDADTDAKRKYVRENWGVWLNENGYADEDDPEFSYKINVYV